MATTDRADLLDRLATAALAAAGAMPWEDVTLLALATGAGTDLVTCARSGIGRTRVREELERRLDRAMLAVPTPADAASPSRDRLFDVLMGRFDALEADRAAWTSILIDEAAGQAGVLAGAGRRAVSARWALEAAGISTAGAGGLARIAGVARCLRRGTDAWLQDGPDLARTMRVLDALLRDGERALRLLERADRGLSGAMGVVAGLAGSAGWTWPGARAEAASGAAPGAGSGPGGGARSDEGPDPQHRSAG